MWLAVLDYAFLIFHTSLILLNLFGWIWRPLRKANLVLLLLTAASWFGLGIWYGWGYCLCTDWHWQVLAQRGVKNLPRSYITYLVHQWSGWNPPELWVQVATALCFALALAASLYTNYRDLKRQPGPA